MGRKIVSAVTESSLHVLFELQMCFLDTVLKWRLLSASGWTVIPLPYQEVCFASHNSKTFCVGEWSENGAVLGMRASCEVGAEYGNQIPRTAPVAVLTWCREPVKFWCYGWTAVIHLREEEVPYM
jgi:hypothetical protein